MRKITRTAYTVKHPFVGFEHIQEVIVESNDGLTSVLHSSNNNDFFRLTLINAATDKKYFEIPADVRSSLQLSDTSNYSVYFTVIIHKNIHDSVINLGAPIVVNEDNKTIVQCLINNDTTTIREIDFINLPTLDISNKYNLKISNLIANL
ncbi:MAG: flagellar assembly protein FliW [Campylobacteraceae bacterium]|nr:flagellar assembly protein FliW [Campylobacteraceae bacterium]